MEHWKNKPDQFFPLPAGDSEYIINAKYDHIQHFPWLNIYRLNIVDDEEGVVGFWLEPHQAKQINLVAGIPLAERQAIYNSEVEEYVNMRDMTFGWEHRLDKTVPEPYEILNDGEIVNINHE